MRKFPHRGSGSLHGGVAGVLRELPVMETDQSTESTLYERIGGGQTFERLAHDFYVRVAADQRLRALYPEEDLAGAEERLRLFLEQYWGGPREYSATRGHPRLRIRHAPYAITPQLRDVWVQHMLAALDTLDVEDPDRAVMRDYFERAATFMINAG